MAFTQHGHQIEGTPAEERPPGMAVAHCGGPALCAQCSRDANAVQVPQVKGVALIPPTVWQFTTQAMDREVQLMDVLTQLLDGEDLDRVQRVLAYLTRRYGAPQ